MSIRSKIRGTLETIFQIGKGGPQAKNNAGVVEFRNASDAAFAIVRGATPVGNTDLATKLYVDSGGGGGLPAGTGVVHVTVGVGSTSLIVDADVTSVGVSKITGGPAGGFAGLTALAAGDAASVATASGDATTKSAAAQAAAIAAAASDATTKANAAQAAAIAASDTSGAAAAAQAASQPVDSDLTAIAALSTTAYGRAFLALADAAAGRTALALGTASTHATGDYDASGAAAAAIVTAEAYAEAYADAGILADRSASVALTNHTIVAASNTITDTAAAAGDLLWFNGTRFVRLARGTANQVLTTNAGATDIAWAAAAGGSASTGSAGQVDYADGSGGWTAATGVLAGAGFFSFGATPATAGEIRTNNAGAAWRFRDSTNAIDTYAIQAVADALYIGCDSTFSANQPGTTNVYALGAVAFGLGGTTYQYIYNGNNESWVPRTGSSTGSSPHAVDGGVLVTPGADANVTLSGAQYMFDMIKCAKGSWTAGHSLIFPAPASMAVGYYKTIWNASTFTLTVSTGTGTTKTLITGDSQRFWFDDLGVIKAGALSAI